MARLVTFLGALSATLSLVAGSAGAAPYAFTYSSTIFSTNFSSLVSTNDSVTVTVIADNGNATTASQSWGLSDIVSVALNIGTYSASYLAPFRTNPAAQPIFITDAAGVLLIDGTGVAFAGNALGGSGTDNFGTGISVFLNDGGPNNFSGEVANFANAMSTNDTLWSAPVAVPGGPNNEIPEPATVALLGLGLLGLGAVRCRRGL